MSESISPWAQKLVSANKLFREWETRFKCRVLEDYIEGFHWREKRDYNTINYMPYTLNLFLTTIQAKLATWKFERPQFLISPEPSDDTEFDIDSAIRSANIKQDALNTIVRNKNVKFPENMSRALRDSFSYFGLMEVGYAKDWRNPQKEPILTSDHFDDGNVFGDISKIGRVLKKNTVPWKERFYTKRIKPSRFRVSVTDAEDLEDFGWVGYYEYFYTKDLKKSDNITWPAGADQVGSEYLSAELSSGTLGSTRLSSTLPEEMIKFKDHGVSKCWHIWDLVAKTRYLFLDAYMNEPLFEEDFERLPFIDLRWNERTEGFYPIPLAFNWLSPQDEINEAREQTRSYRRRFTRKFTYKKSMVTTAELEKFTSGPDGVLIENIDGIGIVPIQNPDLTATTTNALIIAKDDFQTVANTTSSLQPSDRQTATEATIHANKDQIAESAEVLEVNGFYAAVGQELLCQMQEKMEAPLWIKVTMHPDEATPLSGLQRDPLFQKITSEDLNDGYDMTIDIEVNNETPQAVQAAQQAFVQFLSMVQNFPAIAMSPYLIRYAAKVCGFRDERVIHQYQQVAILSMAAKASQGLAAQGQPSLSAAMGNGANGNNVAAAKVSQMAPPVAEQTNAQIENQSQLQ